MGRRRYCWVAIVIGLSGWLLNGCASNVPEWAQYRNSPSTEISEPAKVFVRSQATEGSVGGLQKPTPLPAAGPLPPPAIDLPPPPAVQPGAGTMQVSLKDRGTVRVSVRVWVNGRPIFDEELRQMSGAGLQEARRVGKEVEFMSSVIDQVVDQELMYQDAMRKLEKSTASLNQLKTYVDSEFDKTMEKMRKSGYPENEIREIEPVLRRLMERNLISGEYARSRIKPKLDHIGLKEVAEYYKEHLNEFQSVDKVVWQDVFIKLSPDLPTLEAAKRFGEELVNKCRRPEDFEKLMMYNQGDSVLRNGEGLGTRLGYIGEKGERVAGDIRPAELEEHLAKLREGEIGPVIPFATGVHLIRVTKREYAGQLPLNDQVQKIVKKKLENEIADREYKSLTRELRVRAVVRIEKEAP